MEASAVLNYGDRSSKVESRIVIPVVVGSNPIGHPILPAAHGAYRA
jgi:hypothetical protein